MPNMSDDRLNVEQLLITIGRTRLFKQLLCNCFLLTRLKLRNLGWIHVLISVEWCALSDKI